MAKIANKLTDLVGNTPLMELSGYSGKYGLNQNIIAKLEAFNPAGSVKDRVALSMIEDAEARGALKPGATIIEPTSGNTGVGLAMVATIKGYHLILTMPETMSLERRNLLKALGAQIVLTDGLGGMAASIAKAQELRDSIPGSVILQQFENPANAAPGSVLAVKPLTIACQDGSIVLDSVTPEGSKSMAGTAWAAGRRLKAGDSL